MKLQRTNTALLDRVEAVAVALAVVATAPATAVLCDSIWDGRVRVVLGILIDSAISKKKLA